jgi:DNA-binding MltR family transcriptional regulator
MLDAFLEMLLKRATIVERQERLFDDDRSLGTLSAKAALAYALGLISQFEFQDVSILRRIRNDFAHSIDHTLSFESEVVANRIRSLNVVKLFDGHPILSGTNNTLRWRFEVCVAILVMSFSTLRLPNIRVPVPPVELNQAPDHQPS